MPRTPVPILFDWDGEQMKPLNPLAADRQYVVGERYRLAVEEERNAVSHNHYFASVHEAWLNLPRETAAQFPTENHLRKYALVKAGFRDERSIVASSKAEALRLAAFIKPMDEFAVVTVSEAVVVVHTAKSQSTRAMGKAKFQESKTAVLGIIAGMIGVSATALGENTWAAA